MTWMIVAFATVLGAYLGWRRLKRRRGGEEIGASLANLLFTQVLLFPPEVREPLTGRAADRFSVGYVYAFATAILISSGKLRLNDMPPILNVVFERLFGLSGGGKVIEHSNAMRARDEEAARGAAAGREDARRFLESGGKRGVTAWLQHVRADLFRNAQPVANAANAMPG